MVAVGQTGGFAPGTLDLFLKLYQVITSASDFLTITFMAVQRASNLKLGLFADAPMSITPCAPISSVVICRISGQR
jgi:hypothetical protein